MRCAPQKGSFTRQVLLWALSYGCVCGVPALRSLRSCKYSWELPPRAPPATPIRAPEMNVSCLSVCWAAWLVALKELGVATVSGGRFQVAPAGAASISPDVFDQS